MHGSRANHAGFANEFRIRVHVRGRLAAEVSAAVAQFRAGPYQTVFEVAHHLFSGFLAKGLVGGLHDGIVDFVDFRVILTRTHECINVAFTIQGFRGEPMVAVETAIRVDPLFCKRLKVSEFFRFHLNGVYVEIFSLCVDGHGRRQTYGDSQSPDGSFEHSCLLSCRHYGE